MNMEGVAVALGDQCQYGAADNLGNPLRKPTKFMTNSSCIAEALSERCKGRGGECSRKQGGNHALCNGARAKAAAIYPFALCRAILTGSRNQMLADGRLLPGHVGLNCVMLDRDVEESIQWRVGNAEGCILKFQIGSEEKFVDDLTGQKLDPVLCRLARQKKEGLYS